MFLSHRMRLSLSAVGLLGLSACSNIPTQPTLQTVRAQNNPTDLAQRTITNFTPALRCMDDMLFRNGTRDVTLMMEELRDSTQRVPISTRDMMTSAVSEMTRRSRAVRLSVFGSDQQNLAQVLQQAQKNSAFAVVPEFNVRGTVSQLDDDVKRESASFSLLVQDLFGIRLGTETRFSVLAFDAAVVRTDTFTLVPGVTSKNTTVLSRRDTSAGDGQARIKTTGTVFAFSSGRSEGTASAARNMVELAVIELVGKLTRTPYWQCLGIDDGNAEVQREIEDWFFSMDETERTIFLKTRLRERGYFDGALDSSTPPTYNSALQAYRLALGLAAVDVVTVVDAVDMAFFQRFITRRVATGPLGVLPRSTASTGALTVTAKSATGKPPESEPENATTVLTPPPPLPSAKLQFKSANGAGQLSLQLSGAEGAYVYCYAQDPSSGAIRRIFPNRFAADPRVNAGRSVSLPGRGNFKLSVQHQHACMLAPREVYNVLPPQLRWGDFEDIRLPDFDAIRQRFAEASGLPVTLLRPQP